MRTWAATALLLVITLSGCTDDGGTDSTDGAVEGALDEETFQLEVGKGAIEGLLVDDRFRPIDLEDDPQTEFQREGFILLQETGQQVQTDENGQFAFVDLEPGRYTLRVNADGHESVPSTVTVEEGLFADAQLLARRVASAGGAIITQEFAIFIPCNAYATVGCVPDASGETYRAGIDANFSALAPDVTYSVWEMRLNNPYIFCMEVREEGVAGASTARHFGQFCEGQDSTYTKGVLLKDEIYDEENSNDPWDPTAQHNAILFTYGNTEATCWAGAPHYRCVGVGFGIKAQILVSMFLGEPEVDMEAYCVLC